METIEFKSSKNEKGYLQIDIIIDGDEAGYIEIGGEEIMYIQIDSEFRGKGLYKMMLIAAFNMSGKQILYSNDRNEYSNPAYEHWTGGDLEENENIAIVCDGEDLHFQKV